ncbi:hypothetical protein L5F23_04565 [Aliarcobacter butzleri]|uniref:hypothetical protein n=1 Tax=Aliarcobacter butzleri TaxID=28197 RepID=UPI001ED9F323|nr:hypothetical protein [Aliarcobacter butzleri]MCG3655984.1 hypothetical protein [Aliarcobacter butzleri]
MRKELETLTISKGTLIHINGIPFELSKDTKVMGLQSNLDLAFNLNQSNELYSHLEQSGEKLPTHRASQDEPVASLTINNLSLPSIQGFNSSAISADLS